MSETKDLMIVEAKAIPAIVFSPDTVKLDAVLADYPADKIPTDLSIKEDYKFVEEGKKAHLKLRQNITNDHKELKSPYRVVGLQLDKSKNIMLEKAKPVEDAYIKAKKEYDDIEKNRLEKLEREAQDALVAINNKASWIGAYPSRLIGKPSSDMLEVIEKLKDDDCEWAGGLIESTKMIVVATIEKVEELYKMQVENENAERLAKEERVKREAEEKEIAEQRAIEQKLIDKERADMEEEREKLQAEKDRIQEEKEKIEREGEEAKAELQRLKDEANQAKIDEANRIQAEKTTERERVEAEELEKKLKAELVKQEKDAKALARKQANELKAQLDSRRKETLQALAEILRSDKPVAVVASEILGKVESGDIPNLTFV